MQTERDSIHTNLVTQDCLSYHELSLSVYLVLECPSSISNMDSWKSCFQEIWFFKMENSLDFSWIKLFLFERYELSWPIQMQIRAFHTHMILQVSCIFPFQDWIYVKYFVKSVTLPSFLQVLSFQSQLKNEQPINFFNWECHRYYHSICIKNSYLSAQSPSQSLYPTLWVVQSAEPFASLIWLLSWTFDHNCFFLQPFVHEK